MDGVDWAALAGVMAPILLALFGFLRWDARNSIEERVRAISTETASAERLAERTFASREDLVRVEERLRQVSEQIEEMRGDCRGCRFRNGGGE